MELWPFLVGVGVTFITLTALRNRRIMAERKQEREIERAEVLRMTKLQKDAGFNVTGWPVTSDYDKNIVAKYRI